MKVTAPAPLTVRRRCLTIALIVGVLLPAGTGVAVQRPIDPVRQATASRMVPAKATVAGPLVTQTRTPLPVVQPGAPLPLLGAVTPPEMSLRDGPVAVPLELRLPTLDVRAPVSGVGVTPKNVMDAPMGPAGDPVWDQAFWYRGSAVPGEVSTALIAGHVNGPKGLSAAFAHIGDLRPGDPVVVRDTRTGTDVRFSVTSSETYSLDEAADPVVLARIYGAGPVSGTAPQPSADGLAHVSLITCTGTFRKGTHDHRLVVYATRVA